jgi:hypothetical protein
VIVSFLNRPSGQFPNSSMICYPSFCCIYFTLYFLFPFVVLFLCFFLHIFILSSSPSGLIKQRRRMCPSCLGRTGRRWEGPWRRARCRPRPSPPRGASAPADLFIDSEILQNFADVGHLHNFNPRDTVSQLIFVFFQLIVITVLQRVS